MKCSLVAFPESSTREELDAIRNALYQGGFRYTNHSLAMTSHVTLAQLKAASDPQALKSHFSLAVCPQTKISLQDFSLLAQEHTWIHKFPEWKEKYPQGATWIAFHFQSPEMQQLAKNLMIIAQKLHLDESFVYAQGIAQVQGIPDEEIQLFDYLANHLNLCNYARPEKSAEALNFISSQFKRKKLIFDRIALCIEQEMIWELPFQSS